VKSLRIILSSRLAIHLAAYLAVALAVTGCEKTNDLPRLQEEALATANRYQERLDELSRRILLAGQRAGAMRDAIDAPNAARVYQKARASLERSRNDLRQVPTWVQNAAKEGKQDELRKIIAELHERVDETMQEAAAGIDAVESWLAISEQRKSAPQTTTAQAAAPTEPAGDDAPGSPAPTR
jgi:hypothetical protein